MPQNYLAAFRGPSRAQLDQEVYSNTLLKNDVDRIPQYNRQQDQQIQAADQNMAQSRTEGARRMAADMFSAAADSQDPIATGAALVRSPIFRQVADELKLPADQFNPQPGDNPEQIREGFRTWAQAVGAQSSQQQRVQSTQVLEDGTIAYVTSDGKLVRTNERARNPMQLAQVEGAPVMVDRLTAQTTALSTPKQETTAAAERAGAEAWARAAAQAGVDVQKEQGNRQGTLGVWQVAREGLMSALGGTTTGPFMGRLPAVTAGQQVAEGAVAAVAPVLKQLFRSAGEGVFTDRDQQLLIDMIPSRTDLPEARISKMQMINAIIEAKLNQAAPNLSPGGQAPIIPGSSNKTFATDADAAAAASSGLIRPGDRITVGGRSGVWQ